VIEKGSDLLFAHRRRMTAIVKQHEAPNPSAVGYLGSPAVMSDSQAAPNLLEQSKPPRAVRWT
jgi:hypothetical protein